MSMRTAFNRPRGRRSNAAVAYDEVTDAITSLGDIRARGDRLVQLSDIYDRLTNAQAKLGAVLLTQAQTQTPART